MKIEKIEKRRKWVDTEYRCPGCGIEYGYYDHAEACLRRHNGTSVDGGKPGDQIEIDDGTQGPALGHSSGYWPKVIFVTVVTNDTAGKRYLFERLDGTRAFAWYGSVKRLLEAAE